MSSVGRYFPTVATGDRWSASTHNAYVKGNMDVSGNGLVSGDSELVVGAGYQTAGVLAPGSYYDVLQADPNSDLRVSWTHDITGVVCQMLNTQVISTGTVTKLDIGDVVYDPLGMADIANGAITIPLWWKQPRYFMLGIDMVFGPLQGVVDALIEVGYAKGGTYAKWQSGVFPNGFSFRYFSGTFLDVADATSEPGNKIELYMLHRHNEDISIAYSRIYLLLLR